MIEHPNVDTVNPPKNQKLAGQAAIFLCAILWSTSGLFIKIVDWHPVVITGVRSLVAALFMLAVRMVTVRPGARKSRKGPLWAGAFVYSFTMLAFVIANKTTTAANAIVLQYSAPVWAALLGWFLIREKPRWEHWVALVLVFGGFCIFFKDGVSGGAMLGNGIAVLSGVFFGANSVFLRMQKDGNPSDSMLLSHVVTFVISIPFIVLYPPVFAAESTFPILFMGIVQIGGASLFYSYGIKRVSALESMLTATVEPLLNPVWVFVVTGEKPSAAAVIGGAVILAAVIFTAVVGKRRETVLRFGYNRG